MKVCLTHLSHSRQWFNIHIAQSPTVGIVKLSLHCGSLVFTCPRVHSRHNGSEVKVTVDSWNGGIITHYADASLFSEPDVFNLLYNASLSYQKSRLAAVGLLKIEYW